MSGSTFKGRIGRYDDDSEPLCAPVVKPPEGAPNVVIVVLDDVVRFTPIRFSATGAGLACGYSSGLPVSEEFEGSFRFRGTLKDVTVAVEGGPHIDAEGDARLAIASQ